MEFTTQIRFQESNSRIQPEDGWSRRKILFRIVSEQDLDGAELNAKIYRAKTENNLLFPWALAAKE